MTESPRSLPRSFARPLVAAVGAAAAGVLLFAPAAAAHVTITPTTAVQGGETSVTFLVENERPGAWTTRVEVDLPADAPVSEVYPMTVPDWAPQIITHAADQPLPGIHAADLSTATSAVIWTRAADAPPAPRVERLRIEMGPLPQTDRFAFTVIQTYSDGTVQRWNGGAVLQLTPSLETAASDGGHPHGQPAAVSEQIPEPVSQQARPAAATTPSADDGGVSLLDILVGGGLAVAVVLVVLRAAAGPRPPERPEPEPQPQPQPAEDREPVR